MQLSRDNHYVPQWYQRGFLSDGNEQLHYLNLIPDKKTLLDGRTITYRALNYWPPSKCFFQTDLYSTFFGSHIDDEIERRLFGEVDRTGAPAVNAFIETNLNEWIKQFEFFYEYLDSQKIRTPKGLDWLRAQYPGLEQNALMMEMQSIKNLNCTLWSESVREIVSAEQSTVKFIVSDHPVTVYNYACPPENESCLYPNDPQIALKGSQTIFPLDQNHCLILTNLEYAQDPDGTNPLEPRTFARRYRTSLIRTDAMFRERQLSVSDVEKINSVLKSRAKKYIGAGQKAWLYPEESKDYDWSEIRKVLLPPKKALFDYGGETFIKYRDGRVHHQDAFGRTSPLTNHLKKQVRETNLKPNDLCGCGSGKKYKKCCRGKPEILRPSWTELSIRERNIALCRGIMKILGLGNGKDWNDVRRELNDNHIKRIHEIYATLWPIETDLLSLLPKPDGEPRFVYTGLLDPRKTPFIVANGNLYFGDILVQNPFTHPASVNPEFSPVENPGQYKQQTLKNIFYFLELMPAVAAGFISLVPDPCSLDNHLQTRVMQIARDRPPGFPVPQLEGEHFKNFKEQEFSQIRALYSRQQMESILKKRDPDGDPVVRELVLNHLEKMKEDDPLILLQENILEMGQTQMFHMTPNFDMSLYLAQATGSCLLTDNPHRWREFDFAQHRMNGIVSPMLSDVSKLMEETTYEFIPNLADASSLRSNGEFGRYRKFTGALLNSLTENAEGQHVESLINDLNRAQSEAINQVSNYGLETEKMKFQILCPDGGIHYDTGNRLLVTQGVERFQETVPMAIFMEI